MLRLSPGSSWRGTIFNLVNSMIGGGILGLPFAVQQCGLVLGVLLIGFIAILTDLSAYMVVYVCDATRTKSLDTMANVLYGSQFGTLLNVTIFLNNLGSCSGYVVILGDLLPSAMQFLDAPAFLQERANIMIAVGATVLLPLASLKSMSALSNVSLVCFFMILIFVATLFCMGAGIIDVSKPDDAPLVWDPQGPVATLRQAPCIFFAYICHMNIPILYGELRRQRLMDIDSKYKTKRSKMMMAMHISVLTCFVVYLVGAVFGYIAFRDRVEHDVLLNLTNDTFVLAPYIKLAYAVVIICSYPIMSFSCVESVHGLMYQLKLVGQSFLEVALMSPAWSPRGEQVAEGFRKVNILETEAHLLAPGPYEPAPQKKIPQPSSRLRFIEVCATVATTLFIGIAVPDVSVVFGLTGGICCSCLMYIFPALFYLKVKHDERSLNVDAFGLETTAVSEAGTDCFQTCGWFVAQGFFWGGLAVAVGSTTLVVMELMGGS